MIEDAEYPAIKMDNLPFISITSVGIESANKAKTTQETTETGISNKLSLINR